MNKQLWNMYKESPQGKACIELFNPDVENASEGAFNIWQHATNWGEDKVDASFAEDIDGMFWLWSSNLSQRGFIPEEWTSETYNKFVEDYDILRPLLDDKGELQYHEDESIKFNENAPILRKDQFRIKASNTSLLSLLLYYSFEKFKPILLPRRFDIIQRKCDALGIEMPAVPRSKDYKAYCNYYFEICECWNLFQKEYELTDAELCACI